MCVYICSWVCKWVNIHVLEVVLSVSWDSSPGGLTFLGHADLKTLLQPAVLAAVACDLVNLTVLVSVAGVHHVLLDTAAEETLEHQEARDKRGEGKRERESMYYSQVIKSRIVSLLYSLFF